VIVTGISMVRNEVDIIATTIRHMAYQCDNLIVADNGSTDGTREILGDLAKEFPLHVVDDSEPAYYQARKMTQLAELAADRANGDDMWIIPFDADELWNSRDDPNQPIRDLLEGQRVCVAQADLFDYRATALDPVVIGPDVNPIMTMQWCTAHAAGLPKVAFRWQPGAQIHQGNHGVDLPDRGMTEILLRVNHFPYRSAHQFVAKALQGAAAYAATDLPDEMGAHWRAYGRLYDTYGRETLEDVFRQYFWVLSPTDAGLVHQPVIYHGGDL
jgi:hypothetical protein